MSILIFALPSLNRPVFVSIIAVTLAACSGREVNNRDRGAAFSADAVKVNADEAQNPLRVDGKGKSETSFLALSLPDTMPLDVTTVQVALSKVDDPAVASAGGMDDQSLMLTGGGAGRAHKNRKKCGTLLETQHPRGPIAQVAPSSPSPKVDPVPMQPEPPVAPAAPAARPVPTLGGVPARVSSPASYPVVIIPIFIMKCESGSPVEICGLGPSHLGRPDLISGSSGHGVHPLIGYYGSSGSGNTPLATTEIWGTISSSTTYSFPATGKEIKIDNLKVGTYQITIDLTNSDTGKVVEHGEGIVIVEAGKQAVAHIKLSPVPAATGSLLILLDRGPVVVATTK